MRPSYIPFAITLSLCASKQVQAADAPSPSARLFSEKCATCHNVGGGKKVGPDLLGVTERRDKAWFTNFVKDPNALIEAQDPVAVALLAEYGVRMPQLGILDAEAEGLWNYLAACTQSGGCTPVSLGPKWGTDASAEEVAEGKALFFGEHRLQKGGAPCFVCHNVRGARAMGGGSLGPDLTFAYARLGERELEPQLAEMNSPVMKAVYAQTPLTEAERYALKAFMADLARNGEPPKRPRDFVWLGLEGMGLILGAFVLAWGRHGKGKRSS